MKSCKLVTKFSISADIIAYKKLSGLFKSVSKVRPPTISIAPSYTLVSKKKPGELYKSLTRIYCVKQQKLN